VFCACLFQAQTMRITGPWIPPYEKGQEKLFSLLLLFVNLQFMSNWTDTSTGVALS
jgi:hypothetical protein